MTKILVCDPPEGWRYGFPDECPEECITSDYAFIEYLREHDYPEDMIGLALRHSRYWEVDAE